ncbi:hypothetical protein FQN52_007982 [Onygenales sp. PD_12]|nr:hypothetical protein FQN52_007982 [Onygenales sp. PD_12]
MSNPNFRGFVESSGNDESVVLRKRLSKLNRGTSAPSISTQKKKAALPEPRAGHDSYFAYLESKRSNRSRHPDPNHLAISKSKRKLRKRQELIPEPGSDSPESDDGDVTSSDEGGEEEDPENPNPAPAKPEPNTPSLTNPMDAISTETGLSSGGISVSPSETGGSSSLVPIRPTPQEQGGSGSGLPRNPAHLAVLVTVIVVAVILAVFVLACVMIRSKKRQRPGGLYDRYQGLLRKIGFVSDDTVFLFGSEKTTQYGKDGTTIAGQGSYWDPESSFAKPIQTSSRRVSGENRTSLFRKVVAGALGSNQANSGIPHIKSRPKSLVLRSSRDSSLPNIAPGYEEIQALPQVHTTDSNRSSTLLPQDQGSRITPKLRMPLPFSSKFSWASTPTTGTRLSNTVGHTPRRPTYPSRIDVNDGATVYTTDTEPPRFKTTASWVFQQQNKTEQHAHSSPTKPKRPPSDMESFALKPSRPPTMVMPGFAL